MGLPTGFLEIERKDRPYEKVEARLKNWKEFVLPLPPARKAPPVRPTTMWSTPRSRKSRRTKLPLFLT